MPNTKLTKERLKVHFQYGKMIYIVIAIVAVMLADVLFTVTAYRSPDERKVDIYLVSHNVDVTNAEPYEQIALEAGQAFERERDAAAGIDVESASYKPTLEAVEFYGLVYDAYSENAMYDQQRYLMTLAAQEGDIFIVSRSMLEEMIEDGLAVDLTPYIESGVIDPGDRNLLKVTYPEFVEKDQPATGKECIYALQAETLTGLWDAFDYNYTTGVYMVLMCYSDNVDTSAAVMQSLIDQFEIPVGDNQE